MRVVNARQMREIDRRAIDEWGIPGMVLMENAAQAVVREISKISRLSGYPTRGSLALSKQMMVLILAGKGNNGGDGLAVARHLQVNGFTPVVYLFAAPDELSGDAFCNYSLYIKMAGKLRDACSPESYQQFEQDVSLSGIIVDALFGTGFSGQLPDWITPYTTALSSLAAAGIHRKVIAVDIASGLDAASGRAALSAIRADVTVTFGLPKLGHFLEEGPEYTGELVIDPISLPEHVIAAQNIHTQILTADIARGYLPKRSRNGHKGTHGRGLIIGGSEGMSGAVILAGRAALRTGIGLVQIVAPTEVSSLIDAGLVEATVWPVLPDNMDICGWKNVIEERLVCAQACAVGPGLKRPPEFMEILQYLLDKTSIPLILDADALNLLALNMEMLQARQALAPQKCNLIMTPHPGEMARLCRISIAEVQHNRLELTARKAVEWNTILVLKGANTIIASPQGAIAINATGNSGLGTGGTGDVLTGSILAWLAQGLSPLPAASLAVYLHGRSADHLASVYSPFGFTAGEVADTLPEVQKELMREGAL